MEADKNKKYFGLVLGIILGGMLSFIAYETLFIIYYAKYSRHSLDNIMKEMLGQYSFKDILSDELLVMSYNYNGQEPRFYSKYMAIQDPPIYDVKIGDATAASSAAPTFFDPKVNTNKYHFTEL